MVKVELAGVPFTQQNQKQLETDFTPSHNKSYNRRTLDTLVQKKSRAINSNSDMLILQVMILFV